MVLSIPNLVAEAEAFCKKALKVIDIGAADVAKVVNVSGVKLTDPVSVTISAPSLGLGYSILLSLELKTLILNIEVIDKDGAAEKAFELNLLKELGANAATLENILAVARPYIVLLLPELEGLVAGHLGIILGTLGTTLLA